MACLNRKRNGPALTNAQRQRRWRDKKRGSAPTGRWPEDRWNLEMRAEFAGIGRTMMWMLDYLDRTAPALYRRLLDRDFRGASMAYQQVKEAFNAAVFGIALDPAAVARIDAGDEPHFRFVLKTMSFRVTWRKARRKPKGPPQAPPVLTEKIPDEKLNPV